MRMNLRFPESKIGYWANQYTEHQKQDNKKREECLIGLESTVQARGYLIPDELSKLARWKAPSDKEEQNAALTLKNKDDFVTEITRSALSPNNDWAKLMTLTALQGVKEPTASAILHLFDEKPYPILDIHALWSVGLPWKRRRSYPIWLEYIEFCRNIANRNGVSMRELDQALWKYSSDYGKTRRPR